MPRHWRAFEIRAAVQYKEMTELNDLFEQIFHSERNFKARTDQLKDLNSKIQDVQMKLDQGKERLSAKQGELVVKNSKLADVEMEVKLLQLRKAILQSQKEDIAQEKNTLLDEYQGAANTFVMAKQMFLERLEEFSLCYDLHGSGLKHREEEDKKKMTVLQDELILLETELVEMESYSEDVKRLQSKLTDAEYELKQEKEKEKDIKAKILEQEAQIQQLKREKISGSNNSELNRLQSELDACKNSREEELCKELSKELEQLQKECYHKQMKLQTARQSRKTTPPTGNRKGLHYAQQQCTPQQPGSYSETFTKSGHSSLADDEWLETGLLDDFDSNDEGDMEWQECEWDIDEEELEQDMTLDSPPNSAEYLGKKKECPAEKFASHTNRDIDANTPFVEKSHSKVQFGKTTTSTFEELGGNPEYSLSSSCCSSIPRKRQGESIFKAPKAINQISSGTKRVKKVRFHY